MTGNDNIVRRGKKLKDSSENCVTAFHKKEEETNPWVEKGGR